MPGMGFLPGMIALYRYYGRAQLPSMVFCASLCISSVWFALVWCILLDLESHATWLDWSVLRQLSDFLVWKCCTLLEWSIYRYVFGRFGALKSICLE
ncbi:hypothetical protein Nepgr_015910 [Nepenthes gracilis]|uniref:Uncharacterized protein n=1 Tax=Nepenthes gracilis TaxID=150966 RepID=A0AAD3XRJ4_NEPGR|nr:hypothetical protein Nepgr_015910 [Nepenthes gracilis]